MAALLAALPLLSAACHRNLEPYDPLETPRQPDLSRIFPEGAERAAQEGASLMSSRGGRGAPPVAAAGAPLTGTIRLAPEFEAKIAPGAVLFLIARSGEMGPPLAVKRIPDPNFPIEFRIGPEDRMVDTAPFQGPFRLTARIDADGNPMTRNPGDLQGVDPDARTAGASGIEIVINQVL